VNIKQPQLQQQSQQQPQQQQQQHQQSQIGQQRTHSITEKGRTNYTTNDSRASINSSFYSEIQPIQKRFQANPHKSMQAPGLMRFFFLRHGERIDLAFGPQWIEQS
jgi:hypothetical protein